MTTILVVDDMADGAESLAMLFKASGHETHVAFDGLVGVALARQHTPHIIFLDLEMPVLDGFGAVRAIRQEPDSHRPFIVALTAKQGTDVRAETVAAGFDYYFPKPADTEALLVLVEELEGRRR